MVVQLLSALRTARPAERGLAVAAELAPWLPEDPAGAAAALDRLLSEISFPDRLTLAADLAAARRVLHLVLGRVDPGQES